MGWDKEDLQIEGAVLDESVNNLFEYNDGSGRQYKNDFNDGAYSFTLTLERWSGGTAEGTFSGTLIEKITDSDTQDPGTVEITNGVFEGNIK